MPNLIFIDHNDDEYHCIPCDRYFRTQHGLLEHCRHAAVHHDEWCARCERLFVSPEALRQHRTDAGTHNICLQCNIDFMKPADLEEHYNSSHRCSLCKKFCNSPSERQEHMQSPHFLCSICNLPFNSANERVYHELKHKPRNIPCFGCPRLFATYSSMLAHLEKGTCPSGTYLELIDEWAQDVADSDLYTTGDYDYPYTCPACDSTSFRFVSALFQHVESPGCRQGYNGCIRELRRVIKIEAAV